MTGPKANPKPKPKSGPKPNMILTVSKPNPKTDTQQI